MKKMIALAVLMLIPLTAWAAGLLKKDLNGVPFQGHSPTAFYIYSSTKADITHSLAGKVTIKYKASAACNLKLNGAGVSWPVIADEADTYPVSATWTSAVFSVTSSASTSKTKIYIQD